MGNRIRVAVIYGGRSSEHSISCISAGSVLRAIDSTKYDVISIGITQDGQWVLGESDPDLLQVRNGEFPVVKTNSTSVIFTTTSDGAKLEIRDDDSLVQSDIDVVFPVLHGPYGEDGTIQGLCDLMGIPYVGSGVFASAASMDKAHMKAMLRAANISVGPYEVVTDYEWAHHRDEAVARINQLAYPLFVKPCRAGSSMGITKVSSPDDVVNALEFARVHDSKVIVESSIEDAREIECGVLGSATGPKSSVCAEIIVRQGHDFYDFEAKYVDDSVDLVVPAQLSDEVMAKAQELARRTFVAMDCAGLARIDMFVTGDDVVVNELNTMPGFTPISMFPRMWAQSGIDYPTLIDGLLQDALRRGDELH
jgi:D-alanine-D-alanine ligase